jgi:hypothetical protein
MSKMPPALVEALRLRQVVLVVGSRASELAGLPAWPQLIRQLVEWIDDPARRDEVQTLLDSGRAVAALGRLRALLSDEVLAEVIADAVPADRPIPDAIAAAARIPWRAIVTTAVDDLWERAATADPALPTHVLESGEAVALDQLAGRLLVSLFGRASAPATLSLGAPDVRRNIALTDTGALLSEAHGRWSFVFAGFAAGDPDLVLVAGRLLGASASAREHFLLCPGATADEAEALGADLALTAIAGEGDLASELEALAAAWDEVKEASRPPREDVEGWL